MNGEPMRVEGAHAMAYLDMVTQVEDLVGCAAQQHESMYQLQQPLDENILFGKCVHTQRMMARMLVRIDGLLNSSKVHSFETAGWTCKLEPQNVRQFIKAAAMISGSDGQLLLRMMADCPKRN
eukprot:8139891-Pyramimonas_sp.AAC.1